MDLTDKTKLQWCTTHEPNQEYITKLNPWQERHNFKVKNVKTGFFFNWNIVKAMVFPVVMYRCVSWVPKNWWLQNVLEKTLESPLDCMEIKPVHSKENQSWFFIGRTDTEAEAPVLWPLDEKNQLIWKDPDAGKDWGQEEEGTIEDEMIGWHHRLNGHEFEQTLRDGETGKPDVLQSTGSQRVGHNWLNNSSWFLMLC